MKLTSLFDTPWRQYMLITGNYWAFTLTDGALRMLVVLYFYELGYSPLSLAFLFLFYEFFGVVTNLIGGWLGARLGLNRIMNVGLCLQVLALSMLLVPTQWLSVAWVMVAQALSGIAKDLNKLSAKSGIKVLVPNDQDSTLFRWVALLTGSKNALKGIGFFVGGAALLAWGFKPAIALLIVVLLIALCVSTLGLQTDLGKSSAKPKFAQMFSNSPQINALAAARLFLFAARDIWFVVALPVYFASILNWQHWQTGAFMALWIIGYGVIQTQAPKIVRAKSGTVGGKLAIIWVLVLAVITAIFASTHTNGLYDPQVLVIGLLIFGAVFAVNSSLHSYLIVNYAKAENVSMDVGFYYMANAAGRLFGTLLSGLIYQNYAQQGLFACLVGSAILLAVSAALSFRLPKH